MHTFFITTTQSTMSLTERIIFELALLLWPGKETDFFSFLPLSAISLLSEASSFLYLHDLILIYPELLLFLSATFLFLFCAMNFFLFISRTCFSAGKPTRFETGPGLISRRALKRRNWLDQIDSRNTASGSHLLKTHL